MRDIGKNIRRLREQRNMTQDALAESLFVTRQTVSNYETGKSRPDIDMLLKIADVLDAELNELLYGAGKNEDRQKALRSFWFGLCACLVCGFPLLFWERATELMKRLQSGPKVTLQFLVLPLFLLFLSWTFMQGMALAAKAKPPKLRYGKYLYCLVLLLLAVYFVLFIPVTMFNVKSYFVHLYVDGLAPPLGLSGGFSLSSDWLNNCFGRLWIFVIDKMWLFFVGGIMLWLLGRDMRSGVKKLCLLSAVVLCLSAALYLTAEGEYVLAVENPQVLSDVPRGVRVEQWVDDNMAD